MKITTDARAAFLKAITLASAIATSKYNEAYTYLQLKCDGDRVHVSSTDGDTTTTYTVPAVCENLFETCETLVAPGKMLTKLVSMLPEGDLTLQSNVAKIGYTGRDYKTLQVKVAAAKYELVADKADDLVITPPSTEEIAAATFYYAKDLCELLEGLAPVMSKDSTRGPSCGIQVIIQGNRLTGTATDTHALRTLGIEATTSGSGEVVLPPAGIKAFIAACKAQGDEAEVTLSIAEDSATLDTGSAKITTKVLDGFYPDARKVMNVNPIGHAVIPRKQLADALNACIKFTDKKAEKCELSSNGEMMEVRSYNQEKGDTYTEVPVSGTPFDAIPLNAVKLQTILKATTPPKPKVVKGQKAPEDTVTIEFCVTTGGGRIARIDGVLLMPMAITHAEDKTGTKERMYHDQKPAALPEREAEAPEVPSEPEPTPEPEAEKMAYNVEYQSKGGGSWFPVGDAFTSYADATRCAEIEAMNSRTIQTRVATIRRDQIGIGMNVDRAMPDVETDAALYTFMLMWNGMPHYTGYDSEAEAIEQRKIYVGCECHVTSHSKATDEEEALYSALVSEPMPNEQAQPDEPPPDAERSLAERYADAQLAYEQERARIICLYRQSEVQPTIIAPDALPQPDIPDGTIQCEGVPDRIHRKGAIQAERSRSP